MCITAAKLTLNPPNAVQGAQQLEGGSYPLLLPSANSALASRDFILDEISLLLGLPH